MSGLLYALAALMLALGGVLALYGHPMALWYFGVGASVALAGRLWR